ncbi:MAG: hypothetical protein Q7R56_01735 [Nanoarchaeota archaeon]|nr:hypothetical protein [Nanoarchaeota archaeon]
MNKEELLQLLAMLDKYIFAFTINRQHPEVESIMDEIQTRVNLINKTK